MKYIIIHVSLFLAVGLTLQAQSQFSAGITELTFPENPSILGFSHQLIQNGQGVLLFVPAESNLEEEQSVVLRRSNGAELNFSDPLSNDIRDFGFRGLSFDGESLAGNQFVRSDDGSGGRGSPTPFFYDSSGIVEIPTLLEARYPGTEFLGIADETYSIAISGDGSVVVGYGRVLTGTMVTQISGNEAFRWSESEGTVGLGTLSTISTEGLNGTSDGRHSIATDVNHDGTVIVGWSGNYLSAEHRAFRWTPENGMMELEGYNEGAAHFSFAVSESGVATIGNSIESSAVFSPLSYDMGGGDRALLWENPTSSAEALWAGYAYDVADGSSGPIVVGSRIDETRGVFSGRVGLVPEGEAVRWTREVGVETIPEWLARTEAPVGSNAGDFSSATSISSDGQTVLLVSTENVVLNEEGFFESLESRTAVARAGDGVLTMDSNLTASLFTGFSYQSVARQLPSMTLNGAHHRVLMDSPLNEEGYSSWATGDFATHDRLDADQYLGEAGVITDFGIENMRFGLGIGAGSVSQDLPFSGESEVDGQFVLGEVNYRFPDQPIILSALAYYGQWDADITRGYLNGGLQDSSRGFTEVDSFAFRLRADWQDAFELGEWSASPRLSYGLISTTGDAYTETGGGFPVSFDGQDNLEHEIRLGLDFDYQLGERTAFRAGVEAVKRFEDESELSGTIIGVNDFTFPGADLKGFWGRANLEVTHLLSEDLLLSFSLSGSTAGADPTFGASSGLQFKF